MSQTVSLTLSIKSGIRHQLSGIRKILLIPVTCILLANCGFHAVYAKTGQSEAVSDKLSEIRIDDIPKREGQVLKTQLASLLSPSGVAGSPAYAIKIKLNFNRRDLGIRGDLRVTRFDVLAEAQYQLIELATNRELDNGSVKTKSSFNRTESEFSTFVAEEDADEQAARELAQGIRERMIYYFSK